MSKFYAVAIGKERGIYETWNECKLQINGYPGNKYRKLSTMEAAQKFLDDNPVPEAPEETSEDEGYGQPSEEGNGDGHKVVKPVAGPSNGNKASASRAKELVLEVWTDGACKNNGKPDAFAGIGVYFGPDHPWNVSEPLEGRKQTNNRAELCAVIRAVKIAIKNGYDRIIIHTDSDHVIDCAREFMSKWASKERRWLNYHGDEVKNKMEWKEYRDLRKQIDVDFDKVEAHKDANNKIADRLAKDGMNRNDIKVNGSRKRPYDLRSNGEAGNSNGHDGPSKQRKE